MSIQRWQYPINRGQTLLQQVGWQPGHSFPRQLPGQHQSIIWACCSSGSSQFLVIQQPLTVFVELVVYRGRRCIRIHPQYGVVVIGIGPSIFCPNTTNPVITVRSVPRIMFLRKKASYGKRHQRRDNQGCDADEISSVIHLFNLGAIHVSQKWMDAGAADFHRSGTL